jgi:hypothetical protein
MALKSDEKRSAAYTRAGVRKKMEETVGDTTITYAIDDDHVFSLPHPMFYDKATKAALKPLKDDDEDGIAAVLLGDQWDDFVAAGGDGSEVQMLLLAVQQETRDSIRTGHPTTR